MTSIPHISPAIINIKDTSVHIIINIIFSYTVLSSTYSCDRRSVNAFFPRQNSKVVFSHEFRPLFLTSTFGASLVGCRLLAAGHQDVGRGASLVCCRLIAAGQQDGGRGASLVYCRLLAAGHQDGG